MGSYDRRHRTLSAQRAGFADRGPLVPDRINSIQQQGPPENHLRPLQSTQGDPALRLHVRDSWLHKKCQAAHSTNSNRPIRQATNAKYQLCLASDCPHHRSNMRHCEHRCFQLSADNRGYCPEGSSHPVGLAGFEPATPCPPVKCRLFVSVRSCSEIALVQGLEHQRTQANISG